MTDTDTTAAVAAALDRANRHYSQPPIVHQGEIRSVCGVCRPLAWWPCDAHVLAQEVERLAARAEAAEGVVQAVIAYSANPVAPGALSRVGMALSQYRATHSAGRGSEEG